MPNFAYPPGIRRATPGELCDCGRPAQTVVTNPERGEVGVCNGPPLPGPCPFCRGTVEHDGGPCPRYRLRLEETT